MLYTTLKVKDNEYKLRLDAKATVALERRLGKNPLDVLMDMENGRLPQINQVISILYYALQKYHKMNEEQVFELYEDMIEDGRDFGTILPIVVELFQVSGFFTPPAEETESPN